MLASAYQRERRQGRFRAEKGIALFGEVLFFVLHHAFWVILWRKLDQKPRFGNPVSHRNVAGVLILFGPTNYECPKKVCGWNPETDLKLHFTSILPLGETLVEIRSGRGFL